MVLKKMNIQDYRKKETYELRVSTPYEFLVSPKICCLRIEDSSGSLLSLGMILTRNASNCWEMGNIAFLIHLSLLGLLHESDVFLLEKICHPLEPRFDLPSSCLLP